MFSQQDILSKNTASAYSIHVNYNSSLVVQQLTNSESWQELSGSSSHINH
jgi:hypothetical protein